MYFGGKDSMLMAKLFQELHRHSDFPFEVKFIVMDPGYSTANRNVIEENARKLKIPIEIQTMMPKLHSTNFEGMELIRPLYLVREDDIKAWRDYNGLHFIQCACKFTDTCTTCNNEENRSKRVEIKQLIAKLKQTNPEVEKHIFKSVENVNIDTVIAWKKGGEKHHFLDSYDKMI